MIVFHGTTADCVPGIQSDGLWPGSHVAPNRDLATEYAWMRGMELGADSCVVIELDVPDAAVIDVQSWWWAKGQMQLPAGCPPSCIVGIEESTERPNSVG